MIHLSASTSYGTTWKLEETSSYVFKQPKKKAVFVVFDKVGKQQHLFAFHPAARLQPPHS